MRRDLLKELNPEQLEAAICQTHCLAVAAPGSGKTKMLSAKAAFLLSGGATVVAVTFTRDAAIELRNRIVSQAGAESLPRLLVGTFHSIDMLMAFPSKAKSKMGSAIIGKARSELKTPWKIVRDGNRRSAVARAIDLSGIGNVDVEEATSIIERVKADPASARTAREQDLARAYTELLERHNVIDFQDILLKTNEGLASGAISPLASDYLLLDEFQDTDLPQYEWAMAHAKAGSIITAVGDDDQSIYAFRRALGYQGMKMFVDERRAAKVVLGTNYRSHEEILLGAGRLIAINEDREVKALAAHKGYGGSAAWERFNTRTLEAEACAEVAARAVKAGLSFSVLARTNERLDNIESVLRREQVPFERIGGGDSLLQTREVAVMVAAFTSLWKPSAKDTDEVLAWCGVDEDDLVRIHRTFGDMLPAKLSHKVVNQGGFKESTVGTMKALAKEWQTWRTYLATDGIMTLVGLVTDFLSARKSGDFRSKRVFEISKSMFWNQPKDGTKIDARKFERRVSDLRAAMSGDNGKSDKRETAMQAKVSLMTAHASKGLEFDQVWIVGADEDAFPPKDGAIQEERRLMYVAMTRARQNLWITTSGKKQPSRFIFESGIDRVPADTFVTA